MCLVLLGYRKHPAAEVLLAGNRDEFYERPATPPVVWSGSPGSPRILAGKDLLGGGTWMGRNQEHLLVALTNVTPGVAPKRGGRRSRGLLVLGLLQQPSVAEAARWLRQISESDSFGEYGHFNLLFGQRNEFYAFSSHIDAQGFSCLQRLEPGWYALGNTHLNDEHCPRVRRGLAFLRSQEEESCGEFLIRNTQRFLCDARPASTQNPLESIFIRGADYGTVSQTVITVGGDVGDRYYHAAVTKRRATGLASIAEGRCRSRRDRSVFLRWIPPASEEKQEEKRGERYREKREDILDTVRQRS